MSAINILIACGPIGAILCVFCSALCSIAPDFMDRHEIKEWLFKIGFILVIVGVIGVYINSK